MNACPHFFRMTRAFAVPMCLYLFSWVLRPPASQQPHWPTLTPPPPPAPAFAPVFGPGFQAEPTPPGPPPEKPALFCSALPFIPQRARPQPMAQREGGKQKRVACRRGVVLKPCHRKKRIDSKEFHSEDECLPALFWMTRAFAVPMCLYLFSWASFKCLGHLAFACGITGFFSTCQKSKHRFPSQDWRENVGVQDRGRFKPTPLHILVKLGFDAFWVLTNSDLVDLIHMLEAACMTASKPKFESGGEGTLNKAKHPLQVAWACSKVQENQTWTSFMFCWKCMPLVLWHFWNTWSFQEVLHEQVIRRPKDTNLSAFRLIMIQSPDKSCRHAWILRNLQTKTDIPEEEELCKFSDHRIWCDTSKKGVWEIRSVDKLGYVLQDIIISLGNWLVWPPSWALKWSLIPLPFFIQPSNEE